jgi:integrase
MLFFEFRFLGLRCREQTLLPDTPANRKRLEKVLAKIESEIEAGTFVYANYFPISKALNRLEKSAAPAGTKTPVAQAAATVVDSVEKESSPNTVRLDKIALAMPMTGAQRRWLQTLRGAVD